MTKFTNERNCGLIIPVQTIWMTEKQAKQLLKLGVKVWGRL